jgi:hypothetical protein
MEKIYTISQFEDGDLITQDGFFLTTQGSFVTIDLITQDGKTLVTQQNDILQGIIFDTDSVMNIGYKSRTNINTFVNYIDQSKINAVNTSEKLYNPSITEKIYGN